MIKTFKLLLSLAVLGMCMFSCETEDPGPLQETSKDFSVVNFDRLEMGSAFRIQVEQGNTYSIQVRGDRRNIDDLDVYKRGTTLVMEFDDHANRKHDTYITITMPTLTGVSFSGASISTISGFESDGQLDVYLSGASTCQLDAGYKNTKVILSGASHLVMRGLGDILDGEVSGASDLAAFDFPVRSADLNLSGASGGKVTVSDAMKIVATGASSLLYRGNPVVDAHVSGASNVNKD
jgi:hypothetical protein